MTKFLGTLFILFSTNLFAQSEVSSFHISLTEKGIRVESPKTLDATQDKKLQANMVAIIVNNKTSQRVYGELKNTKEVLVRFSLKGLERKVLEVQRKDMEGLQFVPISPSYQEVPLKVSQGVYEIP